MIPQHIKNCVANLLEYCIPILRDKEMEDKANTVRDTKFGPVYEEMLDSRLFEDKTHISFFDITALFAHVGLACGKPLPPGLGEDLYDILAYIQNNPEQQWDVIPHVQLLDELI